MAHAAVHVIMKLCLQANLNMGQPVCAYVGMPWHNIMKSAFHQNEDAQKAQGDLTPK